MIPISNAKNKTISQTTHLPNMRHTFNGWFRPYTAITNTVVIDSNGYAVSTPVEHPFEGCLQPKPEEELKMLPAEDRAWSWWKMWTSTDLPIKIGDRAVIDGVSFKVMTKKNWKEAGFYRFELVEESQ